MSFSSITSAAQTLGASLDALAALGAMLRVRRSGIACDEQARAMLLEIVRGVDPRALENITPGEEADALAVIDATFLQAGDLLQHPCRGPGWAFEEPAVLIGQGLTSRKFIIAIEQFASRCPGLAALLREPGVLLDVGTGIGCMAIEAALSWPNWNVVGIDIWEPSLKIAREKIERGNLQNRITLRNQSLGDLADTSQFTMAWIPGAFLGPEIVAPSLERVVRALKPGGWLVFGTVAPPPVPWGEALARFKLTRNGGHPWVTKDVEQRMAAAGFLEIQAFTIPGTTLVFGRRTG
jgi:SAM-dependent methyltransferase